MILSSPAESHPSGARGPLPPPVRSRVWVYPVVLLIGLFVLTGLCVWMFLRAESAMRDRNRHSLRSSLSANAKLIEIWLDDRRHDAERCLNDDSFLDAAKKRLRSTPDPDDLPNVSFDTQRYAAWVLLTTDRVAIAASRPEIIGTTLPLADDSLNRVMMRSATVSRPFRMPPASEANNSLFQNESTDGEQSETMANQPWMAAIAPISTGGRCEGCFALLLDPRKQFSELLATTRTSETDETYVIDSQGVFLSASRFEPELREVGLIGKDPSQSSVLDLSNREPDLNLSPDQWGEQDRSTWQRTKVALEGSRQGMGETATAYRSYRGVEVMGAWKWLPDYEMNLVTEIAVLEANRSIRYFRITCLMLLSICLATALGAWRFSSFRGHRSGGIPLVDRGERRLGQYELAELIGRGGMGSVYRGTHDVLKREVAIKVLEGEDVNEHSLTRFEREVRLTARLRHPNTIAIYDYGRTTDDTFFYVMEYIDGITIQDLVEDFGRQPPARVISILLQICGSLAEAHEQGLVHRDIKPANILLTARAGLYDMIKVLDFGLVKEIERETMELTQSDAITGTPMYMSPESVRDAATANERSDLYSIGAVGYTLLTGLPTFEGEATVDICLKQLNEDPIRPSERIGQPLPEDLQNILMSCLRKDPEERPRSVQEFAEGLRQCEQAHDWGAADAFRWWQETYAREVDPDDNEAQDVPLSDEDPIDANITK